MQAMHTPRYIFALIIILLVSGCATSSIKQTDDSEATPFSAQGWGGTSCKQLIHDITPKNVGFQQAIQNIRLYQSWASGFVSGVNYENKDAYDVSGDTAPEETFAWLKDYCTEHPTEIVPVALHKLLGTWEREGKTVTTEDTR